MQHPEACQQTPTRGIYGNLVTTSTLPCTWYQLLNIVKCPECPAQATPPTPAAQSGCMVTAELPHHGRVPHPQYVVQYVHHSAANTTPRGTARFKHTTPVTPCMPTMHRMRVFVYTYTHTSHQPVRHTSARCGFTGLLAWAYCTAPLQACCSKARTMHLRC